MRWRRRLLATVGLTFALAGCAGTNVAPAGYINPEDFLTCLLTLGKGESGSINAGAIAALEDGKKRLGVASRHSTVASSEKIDKAIASDISANCSLIVGVGEAFVEPLMEQAKYHRARHFALLLPPGATAQATRDNVAIVTYDLSQPAYVAGFIAAGTSASGKVAAVAGENNQNNKTLISAFAKGVARYNAEQDSEDSETLPVKVIPQTDKYYLGAKSDSTKVKTRVESLIRQGADVIFFAEGAQNRAGLVAISQENLNREKAAKAAAENPTESASSAVTESASPSPTQSSPTPTASVKENDAVGTITAIWYLTDGHETQRGVGGRKPPVLTSIVPDLSQAMTSLIEEARKDRFAANSTQILGTYQNGWVGLTPFYEYGSTVPNQVKKNSQIIEEEFRQGTLKL